MISSKILPYVEHKQVVGVSFPGCSRVLTSSDVDEKIEKMISHKEHLMGQLAHKDTHGGKRHRVRQIELKTQIDRASKKLALLESARDMIEVQVKTINVAAEVFSLIKENGRAPIRYAHGSLKIEHFENAIFVVRRDIREVTEIRGLLIRTDVTFESFRQIVDSLFPKTTIVRLKQENYSSVDGVVVELTAQNWCAPFIAKLRNGTICVSRASYPRVSDLISKAEKADLFRGAINSSVPIVRKGVFAL